MRSRYNHKLYGDKEKENTANTFSEENQVFSAILFMYEINFKG
jgi:hypothetical protein